MSSTPATSSSSSTWYRPALLTLAGVSAAYAIYLIHQNYISPPERPRTRKSLQRHGAVRHGRHSRPRTRTLSAPEARVRVEDAMHSLQIRENEDRPYPMALVDTNVNTPRAPITSESEFTMLPSRLPTAAELQEIPDVSPAQAREIRHRAETGFVHEFLLDAFAGRVISQLEEQYLRVELIQRAISYEATSEAIREFNDDQRPISRAGPSATATVGSEIIAEPNEGNENWVSADQVLAAADAETIAEDQSEDGWPDGYAEDPNSRGQAQGLQNLVYQIAKDQATRDGYIHRGVSCNSCGTMPIRGVRYRCANCTDYDLCEDCEAMQVHIKTHLFFKVRIPAPFLGSSRPALPVWYPGKPGQMPENLSSRLTARLKDENELESHDMEALWDQFRCLAAVEWVDDPNKIGMAIDRKIFDKCFVPVTSQRPPPPNLIYDRMFAFYDTNNDGLIGFEEFISGCAALTNTSRDAKLKRIFAGYDLDGDGYVGRKDFLRMFRAWFILQRELTRDAVQSLEDDFMEGGVREVVMSSQPISSAFPGPIPPGYGTRSGIGKSLNDNGDLAIIDGQGALRDNVEPVGDRYETIADALEPSSIPDPLEAHFTNRAPWQHHRERSHDTVSVSSSFIDNPAVESWRPEDDERIIEQDIVDALGQYVHPEEVMDPMDRTRVFNAMEARLNIEENKESGRKTREVIQERWKRRRFYVDEEEGSSAPPGYTEQDSSDGEGPPGQDVEIDSVSDSRPPSPRSRSSSKVRFEDSVTDTEYETRSNTSSRSIPVGERWGGYEMTEPEKDVGKDILYLTVQQGFNDLLDDLFKDKEDLAMVAKASRRDREVWQTEILAYEANREPSSTVQLKTSPSSIPTEDLKPSERPLPDLLEEAGFAVLTPAATTLDNPSTSPEPPSQEPTSSPDNARGHDGTNPSIESPPVTDAVHGSAEESSEHDPAHILDSSSLSPTRLNYRDPTFPQFRPDSDTSHPSALRRNDSANSAVQDLEFLPRTISGDEATQPSLLRTISNATSPAKDNFAATAQLKTPLSPLPPFPTESQLSTWSKHRAYDLEIQARGGKEGTLNYDEFIRKMVGDEAVSHLGSTGKEIGPEQKAKNIEKLISAGGLGRLGFLGSWVEMASF